MSSAFFYGTLMHPKILKRVIGHDGAHLQIRPAVLLDYTRHKVKGADYPGIVRYSESRAMFGADLEPEERCVRGSLVVGLSDRDMRLLDVFEGDEYTRELVEVRPLGRWTALDETVSDSQPVPSNAADCGLEANAYVWCQPLTTLEPQPWTFEEFMEENAWKWVGPGSHSRLDYREVDMAL